MMAQAISMHLPETKKLKAEKNKEKKAHTQVDDDHYTQQNSIQCRIHDKL